MIAHAIAVAWLSANAQLVAAEYERSRLRIECEGRPSSPACIAIVDPLALPKPSATWIDAWARAATSTPLLSDVRVELVHGLLWAWGESRYDDKPKRGDGGRAACSFGVHFAFTPYTADELEQEPSKCIDAARTAMLWSRNLDPDHPMSGYAGCGKHPCPVAEWRAAILRDLLTKLPPVK
jgi:hypothetical protein